MDHRSFKSGNSVALRVPTSALGSANGEPPTPERLEPFADAIPILPFDHEAARACASLSFKRGSYDRPIAAHALTPGVTLVTDNVRPFADVTGLRVENWMLPLA